MKLIEHIKSNWIELLAVTVMIIAVLIFFSCASIPQTTRNEINSVNDLAETLREEIKIEKKSGTVDYRKIAIAEKLENYAVTLADKSKQEKILAEEKSLADRYRLLRNLAIVAGIAGLGILIYRFRDFIPGFPKLPF